MEGVGGGQFNAVEASLLEHLHGGANRFGFAGDHRHLRRVFVGGNHVALRFTENGFNLLVGCRNAGHQAFVINLHRTHFRAACGRSTQRPVHVEDA